LNPVVSAFAMLFEVMSRAELAPVKPDNAILNVAMTQAPLDIMAPAVLAEAAVK
jgi:hypothetical protein